MLSRVFVSFLFLILSNCALVVVSEKQDGIVERFGKFDRIIKPGLNFKIPLFEDVYIVDLRIHQLNVAVETKTSDNVFVRTNIAVQYYVSDTQKSFYTLSNAKEQISSYVFDVVRSEVPKLTLDSVFEKKDDIAKAIKNELSESMSGFGYTILQTLITDIDPDEKVKSAMNEINAATRLRVAALEKGEAEKILLVKKAEAEAEAKALQGKGIAQERIEIAKGINDSMGIITKSTNGKNLTSEEVMSTLLMVQYFDTLKSIGSKNSNTIFVSNSPSAPADLQSQIIGAIKTSLDKKK